MKKFTNNALWGVISVILNLVILCMVVISAVQLNTYDTKNSYLQDSIRPSYDLWKDSLNYAEKNLKTKQTSLEGNKDSYLKTVDSAKQHLETDLKKYQNDTNNMRTIELNIERLELDCKIYGDTVDYAKAGFKPWKDKYDTAVKDVAPVLGKFNLLIIITSILVALKLICLGVWMMLNSRNIRRISPWWKVNSDYMNVLAWFIPIYNLFGPCMLFSNLFSETRYVLREKSIITQAKDANHMESVSLWWGSFIFAKIIMPFFVGGMAIALNVWFLLCSGFVGIDAASNSLGFFGLGTYFGNTGLFFYLRPHILVLVLFVIGWIVYLLYESYLIFKYNKYNKLLCDNEDKFEVANNSEETVVK